VQLITNVKRNFKGYRQSQYIRKRIILEWKDDTTRQDSSPMLIIVTKIVQVKVIQKCNVIQSLVKGGSKKPTRKDWKKTSCLRGLLSVSTRKADYETRRLPQLLWKENGWSTKTKVKYHYSHSCYSSLKLRSCIRKSEVDVWSWV